MSAPRIARRGTITGLVQGVGFRPFARGLARVLGLAGTVRNAPGGVELVIEGDAAAVGAFTERLPRELPPPGRVEDAHWIDVDPVGLDHFEVLAGRDGSDARLGLAPDLAPCAACLAEIDDVGSRRRGYAFTTCARCGPRYSIVEALPWERARTSMRAFDPCEACRVELGRPGDRREHAETLACPRCGPSLRLLRDQARVAEGEAALVGAVEALRRGEIVAALGVGGFLLLCDARAEGAVATLRARKRRPREPFAVLVGDLEAARRVGSLEPAEEAALATSAAPIVLARARSGALASSVTSGLTRVGLMLPSAPLFALLARRFGGPLVATSANHHGDPIACTERALAERGAGLADLVLSHDRPVAHAIDDAVVHVVAGEARCLRLGRGLAPFELALDAPSASLLALGAELRVAPASLRGDRAVLWPHVGDLGSAASREALAAAVVTVRALTGEGPARVVLDAHPDVGSRQLAEALGAASVDVHHHHAHVAACLAEHRVGDALGFAWDGVGLGPDGALWGGEALRVDRAGATRVAALRGFPLPGGDAAARDGLRASAGALFELGIEPRDARIARYTELASRPRLSPRTSSVGRLFDVVAALTGVAEESSFEGEAALRLEDLAVPGAEPYPLPLGDDGTLDWGPMIAAVAADPADAPRVSSRLHAALVDALVRVAERARAPRVALGGGCFANRVLLEGALSSLRSRGIEAIAPALVPPGDGGLALGQLWVAAHALARA